MKGSIRAAACLLALLWVAAPLRAAVLFEIEDGDGGEIASLWLRAGTVSMEERGTGMRYSRADQRMRVLMHGRRQYMDVNPQMLANTRKSAQGISQVMGGQSKQMLAMLRQQMKAQGMSEAQIEQAMRQMQNFVQPQGQAPTQGKLSARDTGQRGEVAGFPCRIVALSRGGQLLRSVCVGDPRKLGLSAEEADTLISFFDFMGRMNDAAGGIEDDGIAAALASGGDGVPLEVRGAGGRIESRVRGLFQREAPPGTFGTPNGYQPGSFLPF